jgi:SAM-dependent methyltransferase
MRREDMPHARRERTFVLAASDDTKAEHEIAQALWEVASKYPADLSEAQLRDVRRIAFHVSRILLRKGAGARVCDLGGGVGMFSLGCVLAGMEATLVDDFSDPVNDAFGEDVLELHRNLGVRIVSRDVIEQGIDFPPDSFEAVTTFDSMEHWHHSPKALFSQVMDCLVPGGLFVLGAPNNVNLRKRMTVPFGVGSWSSMEYWYEEERFRGHVREPNVSDLLYIASDMGLEGVSIFGRNWLGLNSRFGLVRALTPLGDRILRRLPSLCSDIYIAGTKPY